MIKEKLIKFCHEFGINHDVSFVGGETIIEMVVSNKDDCDQQVRVKFQFDEEGNLFQDSLDAYVQKV